MKYVIFKDANDKTLALLAPNHFGHDGIASLVAGSNPVPASAGELRITTGGEVQTYGFSVSLSNAYGRKIESDPGDSPIINALFGDWFHCFFFDGLTPFLVVTTDNTGCQMLQGNKKLVAAGIFRADLRNRLVIMKQPLDIQGTTAPTSFDVSMLQKTIFES